MMGPSQRAIAQTPTRLGRYRIVAMIGAGPTAVVYKAWDDDLLREVAIKVPHSDAVDGPGVDDHWARARQIADLDPSQTVQPFDSGRADDGSPYFVFKYLSGGNLADRCRRTPPGPREAVRLAIEIAEILNHAHKAGFEHGNLKPSNILFDEQHRPCLGDFGQPRTTVGTTADASAAAYQSPEQLSGEQHRIDARTDVYSLAAILYELLAGQWPWLSCGRAELADRILTDELPPLTDFSPGLPPELAHVLHKALSPRVADRYTTIVDFADELKLCLPRLAAEPAPTSPSGEGHRTPPAHSHGGITPRATDLPTDVGHVVSSEVTKIVPKGLRSFGLEDADFFLELLPGSRGRDGLPTAVAFWKSRIENFDDGKIGGGTEASKAFSVGLMYGPSGCGKSSLVKAGLLPRLEDRVVRIYLEATHEGTEPRLLSALRRRCPQLPDGLALTDSLAELRRGRFRPVGSKIVIFLDQFEQWLHANRDAERPELATALRQCDGVGVQCVLMVRDDFWMAVTRFMHDLEIRLVQGQNCAAVDLFSPPHARKVLSAFGRAFGALEETGGAPSAAEGQFLGRAIEGLSHGGQVIPVQLAMFAEMIKARPWTVGTLDEVGGAEGTGLAFLEETFSSPHAPPQHRRHQRAARAVLKHLLPAQKADIKGVMQPREALLAASGYGARPEEFDELMRILDHELRLVTPTDPRGVDADLQSGTPEPPAAGYYQLTHDYLVPSVRRWLVRRQEETSRGRAELLLEEKAATWSARPERRYLPSWWQWLKIRVLTRPRDWSGVQRAMMRAAGRRQALFTAALLLVTGGIAWAARETWYTVQAQNLRDRLLFVSVRETPAVIQEMAPYRPWVDRALRKVLAAAAPRSPEDLHARLGLLPDDDTQVEPLFVRALEADAETFSAIAAALAPYGAQLAERCARELDDPAASGERQLRAAMLLASFAPPDPRAPDVAKPEATASGQPASDARWARHAEPIARRLHAAVLADPARFGPLVTALAPLGPLLVEPLVARAKDAAATDSDRAIAGNLLLEFAGNRPDVVVDAVLDSGSILRLDDAVEKLRPWRLQAIELLHRELAQRPESLRAAWSDAPSGDASVAERGRPDAAAQAAILAADGYVADRFALCQTLPLDDFDRVAESLRPAGYRPIRVRPYQTGDAVLVAALWTRDDRGWQVDRGLAEADVAQLLDGPRMKSELLVDLAGWQVGPGRIEFAAVWAQRKEGDPEARGYLGDYNDPWNRFAEGLRAEGFGVASQDVFILEEHRHRLCAVLWQQHSPRRWGLMPPRLLAKNLAGELADQVVASIDVVPPATVSRADARKLEQTNWIAFRERESQQTPNSPLAWYWLAERRILVGQDEEASRDLLKFIELGGAKLPETWAYPEALRRLSFANARLGRRQEAEQYLEQAFAAHDDAPFAKQCYRALMEIYAGDLHGQPEEIERQASEFAKTPWAPKLVAAVYAVAAGAVRPIEPERAAGYTERAIEQLKLAFDNGEPNDIWLYLTNGEFQSILDDPRMVPLQIDAEFYYVAAFREAHAGNVAKAHEELLSLAQRGDLLAHMRAQTLVDIELGDDDETFQRIEASIADLPDGHDLRYWGAAASYSLASFALAERDPKRAVECSDRAIALLEKRFEVPWGAWAFVAFRRELLIHAFFAPLRLRSDYDQLVAGLDRLYSISVLDTSELESRVLAGLAPAEHLAECRRLADDGFRPVALDACLPAGGAAPGAASVWHRPRLSQRANDRFAKRQATAAVMLSRLGDDGPLGLLLKGGPDPRLRTFIVHLLGPAGADPVALLALADRETEPSVRQALVLATGLAPLESLPAAEREQLLARLGTLFQTDADPGVHAAAEWTLRKAGQAERPVDDARKPAATITDAGRAWSVTPAGDTLVTIRPPAEFMVGTPVGSPDRHPTNEQRHLVHVPRTFAIAAKEVTVRQFNAFRDANPQLKISLDPSNAPDPDSPVGGVTWYEMAQYCRWLSEQEGLPEDEIGWPPLDEIHARACALKPYFLSRTGYRFPTEAEWELACRGTTETSFAFGEALDLLPRYGSSIDSAGGHASPVGRLLPNEWGLFDMHGNILEMCLAHAKYPQSSDTVRPDIWPTERLPEHLSLRGGSWIHAHQWLRSAARYDYGTNGYHQRLAHIGFRVARSVAPSELLVARRLRRRADELRDSGPPAQWKAAEREAEAAYERLRTAFPDNSDYAWESADFLTKPEKWTTLEPERLVAAEGTTLTRQDDGSILASGKNPATERYTFRAAPSLPSISALRLEVLPDPSFPHGGSGRHFDSGNFHLTTFRAWVARGAGDDERTAVPIRCVSADFSQSQLPVSDSIDANDATKWGVAYITAQAHWACFEFRRPLKLDADSRLVVEIESRDPAWPQAIIGRFRLSVSPAPEASHSDLWRARLGRSSLNGWARLAAAYALAGRRAEAVATLAKAGRDPAGEFVDDPFLLALIEQEIGRPVEALRWLERALARYDKNTPDMDLKHLAADSCVVALEQEPVDVAFISRVWAMVSAAETFKSVTTGNDPLAVALRHGQRLFDEGKTERALDNLEALLLSVSQDFRPTSTRSTLALELAQMDDLFEALATRPAVADALWVARARWQASQSFWKEAAESYSRAIAAVPAGDEWFEYAALVWLAEDRERFAAFSRRGVEEFGESCTPFVAYCLARANCLPEKPVVDPKQLVKWAEQATAAAQNAWYLHALGLAHLRAGNFADAQRWFEQSRLLPWDTLHVQNVLALAITRARLGDNRLARVTLDEARRQMPSRMRDLAYGWDWLEMQILLHEAESLLSASPADGD